MGTFYVTIQVADRFRERYVNVDAMIDTGHRRRTQSLSALRNLSTSSCVLK